MQFVFNGTIDELKETIHIKAKEHNKHIIIYNSNPNFLEIGFHRLDHSGGRFFIANIIEKSKKVILNGETKNVFANQKESKAGRFLNAFVEYLLAYFLLEIILLIPWIFLKDIISPWIRIILPIIYLIIRHFLNKKHEQKLDQEFIEFMSLCTAYTTDEQNWYDAYKRLNLAQGKLKSICDDKQDMLLITYEDNMQIYVGYTEDDKTYHITVVKDATTESRNNPLGMFSLGDKSELPIELQKAIHKFRNE